MKFETFAKIFIFSFLNRKNSLVYWIHWNFVQQKFVWMPAFVGDSTAVAVVVVVAEVVVEVVFVASEIVVVVVAAAELAFVGVTVGLVFVVYEVVVFVVKLNFV